MLLNKPFWAGRRSTPGVATPGPKIQPAVATAAVKQEERVSYERGSIAAAGRPRRTVGFFDWASPPFFRSFLAEAPSEALPGQAKKNRSG